MVICVGIMLFGVGFFSYIMGSLMEILKSYESKNGTVDKTEELHSWIECLYRFSDQNQINLSLIEQIE